VSGEPEPVSGGAGPDDGDDREAVWRDLVARLEATDSGEPPVEAEPAPVPADTDWDEPGFVPAEPESIANAEPALVLAWLGAVGGPVALLLAAMFWRSAPLTAIFGIIAVFLVCAGYLIFRLPGEREDGVDDDGAVL
jgi:hypothetical protein